MHLDTALQLVKLVKLEEVPASEIRKGDIVVAQNQVCVAEEPELIEYGPSQFIDFGKTETSDGYERSIAVRPDRKVHRVPRSWLT